MNIMKNIFIISLLTLSIFILIGFNKTSASNYFLKGFGGKIVDNKATEIKSVESSNYKCEVPGTTITIKPVGTYPMSYFIPSGVSSKTGTTPRSGQWILGLYSSTVTPITCIFQGTPPSTTIVTLPTISLYGTSK
jgi:hypothetical protein